MARTQVDPEAGILYSYCNNSGFAIFDNRLFEK
jgi:hypothetical protein